MKSEFQRALVSVYDKDRLIEIGTALHLASVEILSTGSTAKNLVEAGIPVTEVSQYASKVCTPESTPESWLIKKIQSILRQ
jgi:AICAR transformylase/IMP cyclohydrolase PurH